MDSSFHTVSSNGVSISNHTYALISIHPEFNRLVDIPTSLIDENSFITLFDDAIRKSKVFECSSKGALIYTSDHTSGCSPDRLPAGSVEPHQYVLPSHHTNSFIDAIINAHERNYSLELRPDDFWCAITSQFSAYRHRNLIPFEAQSLDEIKQQFPYLFAGNHFNTPINKTFAESIDEYDRIPIEFSHLIEMACRDILSSSTTADQEEAFQENKNEVQFANKSIPVKLKITPNQLPTFGWLLPIFSTTTVKDCVSILLSAMSRHNNHYTCLLDATIHQLVKSDNNDLSCTSRIYKPLITAERSQQVLGVLPTRMLPSAIIPCSSLRQPPHGITAIHLLGTPNDYRLLYNHVVQLLEFDNNEKHMAKWLEFLLPIIQELVNIEYIGMNMNFWRSMVIDVHIGITNRTLKLHSNLYIGGWITSFCMFHENGSMFSTEFGCWEDHLEFLLFPQDDTERERVLQRRQQLDTSSRWYKEYFPILMRSQIPSNAASARISYCSQYLRILSGALVMRMIGGARMITPRIDYVLSVVNTPKHLFGKSPSCI